MASLTIDFEGQDRVSGTWLLPEVSLFVMHVEHGSGTIRLR